MATKIKKVLINFHLDSSTIESFFKRLESFGELLMTTVADIQSTLDDIAAAAAAEKAEVTTALQALNDQIVALQTQIAGGAGVTAADLDALKQSADALVVQVQGIKD